LSKKLTVIATVAYWLRVAGSLAEAARPPDINGLLPFTISSLGLSAEQSSFSSSTEGLAKGLSAPLDFVGVTGS